ncbi:hypothetical protein D9619_011410 [Psilocybe cf. subviscida]|uniref:Amidase domain-containing protein n=1 Tax=Psilocybe cf. subviscida TaxID=2480587 RepID=A0A8H5F559_9AGAR|nr:hypothetical protein D9619_011410 [Psilocybe cf. subviscida]
MRAEAHNTLFQFLSFSRYLQHLISSHLTHLAKIIADLPAEYHPPAVPYAYASISTPTSTSSPYPSQPSTKHTKSTAKKATPALPYPHPIALTRDDRTTRGSILPALQAHTSRADATLLGLSLAEIVDGCTRGKVIALSSESRAGMTTETEVAVTPAHMLRAYTRRALLAHAATNCLSDVMVPPVEVVVPLSLDSDVEDSHLMSGHSDVSSENGFGDTINIPGRPTTIGYSDRSDFDAPHLSELSSPSIPTQPPSHTSSVLYDLLVNAGALVHCKTTVPPGLLALETHSDLFGVTRNPWDLARTCGMILEALVASTGGGGALVASGGCVVDIGSDVAGSLRIPAGWCGIYSLKPSSGRLPVTGHTTSMPGMEGVPIVVGPMTRRVEDLYEFMHRILKIMGGDSNNSAGDWDSSCVPIAWRDVGLREEGRKLKWGILWDDGIIAPSPACRRALALASAALKKEGHEVVDFTPPNVFEGLKVGYQLMFSDGAEQLREPLGPGGEGLTPASMELLSLLQLPKFLKRMLSTITCLISADRITAALLKLMHTKTVMEERANIVARNEYRRRWAERWREEGLDFVVTVLMALPAVKHGESQQSSLIGAGYTFLFSLLDYSAGCIPVTTVDRTLDALPADFFPKQTSVLGALASPFRRVFRWLSGGASAATAAPAPASAKSVKLHEAQNILAPTPSRLQPAYDELTTIAQKAYTTYDADAMHGLPVGIQLVGRRLEEEKVLEGMFVLRDALRRMGVPWEVPA